MRVTCEALNHAFDMPEHPGRIMSLSSGLTEALFAMGCGSRVAGVSTYCARYVPDLSVEVAGGYLRIDKARFAAIDPDLVLATTGVQLPLARRLAEHGMPVYALPLPNSLYGILENVVLLGGLLNAMPAARDLAARMAAEAMDIAAAAPTDRPRVYVELWCGKHRRTIGGRTFIHDLVTIAGGEPVFGRSAEAYPVPDPAAIPGLKPDIGLFFWEPDYPIDVSARLREHGWEALFGGRVIESSIERGRNLIHDGPSILETARWLQGEIRRCLAADEP
jgi:ABC-type Fe3+-hydroxamate transport system substrate-binding protein